MYPVRLGYNEAINRILELKKNGHHAESLVTSVFTAEKTLRRTLRQLIISCGFKSLIAERIISRMNGIGAVQEAWDIYDPEHRKLSEILSGNDLRVIVEASKLRNKLIHGEKVYKPELCEENTIKVLESLGRIVNVLNQEYGFNGWSEIKSRKVSRLHVDPKVKLPETKKRESKDQE